jgi:hypothetical protein
MVKRRKLDTEVSELLFLTALQDELGAKITTRMLKHSEWTTQWREVTVGGSGTNEYAETVFTLISVHQYERDVLYKRCEVNKNKMVNLGTLSTCTYQLRTMLSVQGLEHLDTTLAPTLVRRFFILSFSIHSSVFHLLDLVLFFFISPFFIFILDPSHRPM